MALKILRQVIFYSALIALWKLLFAFKLWPHYQFPSPEQVLEALQSGVTDRSFLIGLAVSLRRMFIGYVAAVFLGILLGLMIGKWKILEETLGSLILGLQSLPSICWLPLATLWFGLTEAAIIFVVFQGTVLAVVIGTHSGVKSIQRIYLQMGTNMGARGAQMFWYVVLPAALPSIVGGLKQGWIFGWRSLMAGEMLFVSLGLGHLLNTGRQLNDMSQLLAVMGIIVVIGILVDSVVFGTIERKIKHIWGFQQP